MSSKDLNVLFLIEIDKSQKLTFFGKSYWSLKFLIGNLMISKNLNICLVSAEKKQKLTFFVKATGVWNVEKEIEKA